MHDNTTKELVKKLKEDQCNFSEISSILGLSRHSVRSLFIYKSKKQPMKRGPKRKITKSNLISIKREISKLERNKEKINSSKIQKSCELNISRRTVRRYIGRMGYKYKKIK